MHGTRTTAKILVGAAVAALAGCASVDAPPTAPAPAPAAESSVLPAQEQDVAPQIVEGPAREALEAALPAPPPSDAPPPSAAPRVTPLPAAVPERHRRTAAPPSPSAPRPTAAPRHREARPEPWPAVPELPGLAELPKEPPRSRADVCDLGERYGGWDAGSDQARICHGTYGR
ncbi:hypothetical protein ACFWVF_00255 [Streptomyces sp. NPDC058659]|uniref:hypothetical protein n=1 Tax=unclassified Streptomyces TaxID=2593676 RepID=UPI00365F0413